MLLRHHVQLLLHTFPVHTGFVFNKYILEYYRLGLLTMDFIFGIHKYIKLDTHQRKALQCFGHLKPKYIRTMP